VIIAHRKARDITDQKHGCASLAEAKQELKRVDRRKTELFLSTLSHELRTALSASSAVFNPAGRQHAGELAHGLDVIERHVWRAAKPA